MHLGNYLRILESSESQLAEALRKVAEHHKEEPDVHSTAMRLAGWSQKHLEAIRPFIETYHDDSSQEPENLLAALFHGPRSSGMGLLRDLHDLWIIANAARINWEVVHQTARALHDDAMKKAAEEMGHETDRQLAWLRTKIDQAAPQALIAAS